jgi:hypothetical protein
VTPAPPRAVRPTSTGSSKAASSQEPGLAGLEIHSTTHRHRAKSADGGGAASACFCEPCGVGFGSARALAFIRPGKAALGGGERRGGGQPGERPGGREPLPSGSKLVAREMAAAELLISFSDPAVFTPERQAAFIELCRLAAPRRRISPPSDISLHPSVRGAPRRRFSLHPSLWGEWKPRKCSASENGVRIIQLGRVLHCSDSIRSAYPIRSGYPVVIMSRALNL